jgi:hypothetical protein
MFTINLPSKHLRLPWQMNFNCKRRLLYCVSTIFCTVSHNNDCYLSFLADDWYKVTAKRTVLASDFKFPDNQNVSKKLLTNWWLTYDHTHFLLYYRKPHKNWTEMCFHHDGKFQFYWNNIYKDLPNGLIGKNTNRTYNCLQTASISTIASDQNWLHGVGFPYHIPRSEFLSADMEEFT